MEMKISQKSKIPHRIKKELMEVISGKNIPSKKMKIFSGEKIKVQKCNILSVRINGFSHLSQALNRKEIASLQYLFKDIVKTSVLPFGGSVVKNCSDACLITFRSPSNALKAGVRIESNVIKNNQKKKTNLLDVKIVVSTDEIVLPEQWDSVMSRMLNGVSETGCCGGGNGSNKSDSAASGIAPAGETMEQLPAFLESKENAGKKEDPDLTAIGIALQNEWHAKTAAAADGGAVQEIQPDRFMPEKSDWEIADGMEPQLTNDDSLKLWQERVARMSRKKIAVMIVFAAMFIGVVARESVKEGFGNILWLIGRQFLNIVVSTPAKEQFSSSAERRLNGNGLKETGGANQIKSEAVSLSLRKESASNVDSAAGMRNQSSANAGNNFMAEKKNPSETQKKSFVQSMLLDGFETNRWMPSAAAGASIEMSVIVEENFRALRVDYDLKETKKWVQWNRPVAMDHFNGGEIQCYVKSVGEKTNNLEIKLVDADGTNFGYKLPLSPSQNWRLMKINLSEFTYWWGGDSVLNEVTQLYFAVSAKEGGSGSVYMRNLRLLRPSQEAFLP